MNSREWRKVNKKFKEMKLKEFMKWIEAEYGNNEIDLYYLIYLLLNEIRDLRFQLYLKKKLLKELHGKECAK